MIKVFKASLGLVRLSRHFPKSSEPSGGIVEADRGILFLQISCVYSQSAEGSLSKPSEASEGTIEEDQQVQGLSGHFPALMGLFRLLLM